MFKKIGLFIKKCRTVVAIIACVGIAVAAFVIASYVFNWTWTGLPNQPSISGQPDGVPKSLWDWMDLLIVPLVLAGGALMFSRLDTANDRAIANERYVQERTIADERTREDVLQTYFSHMTELLLTGKLVTDPSIKSVAHSRTLLALSRTDPSRKIAILQFLYESGLIRAPQPIIDLGNADLLGLNFEDFRSLSGISLRLTRLDNTNLSFTFLEHADLSVTVITKCSFRMCSMEGIDMTAARVAYGKELEEILARGEFTADFSECTMQNAKLRQLNVPGANFRRAQLAGSDLQNAKFSDADLTSADLRSCDLTFTIFEGAILKGTDMRGSITDDTRSSPGNLWKELRKAKVLIGAILPDGTRVTQEYIDSHP